ncbi:hypothetical protein BRM42_01850 [Xanthomonas oryzae pv. oryzae]|nr:hypothetical protein BRM42_01850 [Xanthomonas oryzae pv. oryzae]
MSALAKLDAQIRHTRQFGGSPSYQTMPVVRDNLADLIEAAAARLKEGCGPMTEAEHRLSNALANIVSTD